MDTGKRSDVEAVAMARFPRVIAEQTPGNDPSAFRRATKQDSDRGLF
jgi:hypothetical protein